MTQPFKIRLTGPNGQLAFEASAPLTETRQAAYTGFDIVHLPTSIQAFRNTGSRKWNITGKLVSRTKSEAQANCRNLDLARTWILPDFGGTGATPPILKLYAYGNKNINGRKVILVSYDWTFTDEVDYIYTSSSPMPVIGQLTLNVEEVYSAEEVTAGAWKLDLAEGGEFAPGKSGMSSSWGDLTTPAGLMQQLGSAITNPSGALQSVSNKLQERNTFKPTLAGVVAGALTRAAGAKIINSPKVQEAIRKTPSFARNIFVAGANAAVSDIGRAASNRVSQATQPTAPKDPFATNTTLTPPKIIGE